MIQLVLRENDLISLPKEIGDLSRLRELHIQGNRLTVLPPEIGNYSLYELRREKISLRGFRPGLTKYDLHSH